MNHMIEEYKKLSPITLAHGVADHLREMILVEKLPPDMRLSERELAELLGVSRTPVREAIRILERDGLICFSHSRRPYVANPSLTKIKQYLEVQSSLESLAGILATEHATDDELEKINMLYQTMTHHKDTDDALGLFKLDMAFHLAIVDASHNEPLQNTYNEYNRKLWRARFISSQYIQGIHTTHKEHNDIIQALLKRDSYKISHALSCHFKTATINITQVLKQVTQESVI